MLETCAQKVDEEMETLTLVIYSDFLKAEVESVDCIRNTEIQ